MASEESPDSSLELKYRIEAETFGGKKFSRVRFDHGLTDRTQVVERHIHIRRRNATEHCLEETVFVKVNHVFAVLSQVHLLNYT